MASNIVPTVIAALTQGAEFLAGSPVQITVPAESYSVTVPDFGPVTVSESGFTLTLKKA